MRIGLYVVYDDVANECGPIGEAVNDGVAMRNFRSAMANTKDKADFKLYYVGELDKEKAIIHPLVPPRQVSSVDPVETKMEVIEK